MSTDPVQVQTASSEDNKPSNVDEDNETTAVTLAAGSTVQADFRSSTDGPRLFALVIGINKYQSDHIPNLAGCINDSQDFVDFLTNTLKVPMSQVKCLANENATRSAIIDTFQHHLIKNPEIREKDAIVFFYAGHGDRIPAPEGWVAEGNQIETICPYDQKAIVDFTKDQNCVQDLNDGIPDRTFDGLMRRLAAKKGDNIVAIFDSCHSGGMARAQPDPGTPRSLPKDICRTPPPPTLDEDIWKWGAEDTLGGRSAGLEVPTGFMYKGMHSHVLLAACRPEERAKELRTSSTGTIRGVFTLHLMNMLRKLATTPAGLQQLSYARLMQRLSSRNAEELPVLTHQNPQCEGAHKDRALFSTRLLLDESNSFAVKRTRDHGWQVQVGSILGVVEGTRFGLATVRGSSVPVEGLERTTLVAGEVEVGHCKVLFEPESNVLSDSLEEARVVVTDWNTVNLPKIYMPAWGPGYRDPVALYQMAHSSEFCDIRLELKRGGRWQVERFDPLMRHYATKTVDIENGNRVDILNYIIRFNSHLYRFNNLGTGIDRHLRIAVQLHALEERPPNDLHRQLIPKGNDFFAAPASQQPMEYRSVYNVIRPMQEAKITDLNPLYGLTLVNNCNYDLFPYVLHFDPSNYTIHKWYTPQAPNTAAPLRRGGILPVGYGATGTDSIRFSLPENADSDSSFMKVFVSTTYVDLDTTGRAAGMVPVPFKNDWNAWVYVLTTSRA